jgi:ubiquinone/menaquinone biosynthesis C-methylase UbiE
LDAPDLTGFARALLAIEGEPERALEIGCGEGDATLFIAREYPRARVRGIDASEDAVRAAAARIGLDPEGRIAFKPGRPSDLPFPDHHFDLVVQRSGRLAAGELARVSRPGGWLIVPTTIRASGPLGVPRPAARALGARGFKPADAVGGDFRVMRMSGRGSSQLRE